MHITTDGNMDEAIKHRINQGRQAIRQLNVYYGTEQYPKKTNPEYTIA